MDMEHKPQAPTPQPQWPETYYEVKPLFSLTKRDIVFAICAVIACILTSVYGIFGGFALGYAITSVCIQVLFIGYFAKKGKLSAFSVICGVLAMANAAVYLCTTNGSVRFFGVLVGFFLSLACFDGLKNGSTKGNRGTLHLFYKAIATVKYVDVAVKSLFSDCNGNKKIIGKVLIGLLCAVPVLFVVIPLLRSSDQAFQGMLDRMFEDAGNTIFKVVFGIALSVFAICYGFCLSTGRIAPKKESKFAGVENVYIVSFLSAISLCYLLYLFSQLAYFFSAFKGFLPDGGITYAQYARKGFFEMCTIAVINLVLVFTSMLIAKKQEGKVCLPIKLLTTFVSVFTLVIISTAISKMVLYIQAYGMTILRLTTSAFMVFLAVVFFSVILRIYIWKINIVKTALLTAGCVVLLLGTVNVNRVCAWYNYDSYVSGRLETVDVEAMYKLGDEGLPYIVKLVTDKDASVASSAKKYLRNACLYDYFENVKPTEGFTLDQLQKNERDSGLSYFSIPRKRAYGSLYDFLKQNPDFSEYCKIKKG